MSKIPTFSDYSERLKLASQDALSSLVKDLKTGVKNFGISAKNIPEIPVFAQLDRIIRDLQCGIKVNVNDFNLLPESPRTGTKNNQNIFQTLQSYLLKIEPKESEMKAEDLAKRVLDSPAISEKFNEIINEISSSKTLVDTKSFGFSKMIDTWTKDLIEISKDILLKDPSSKTSPVQERICKNLQFHLESKKFKNEIKSFFQDIAMLSNAEKLMNKLESAWLEHDNLDPKLAEDRNKVHDSVVREIKEDGHSLSEETLKALVQNADFPNAGVSLSLFTHAVKLLNTEYKILEEHKEEVSQSVALYLTAAMLGKAGSLLKPVNAALGMSTSILSTVLGEDLSTHAGMIREDLVGKIETKVNERISKAIENATNEVKKPEDLHTIQKGREAVDLIISLLISELAPKIVSNGATIMGASVLNPYLGLITALGLAKTVNTSVQAAATLMVHENDINQASAKMTKSIQTGENIGETLDDVTQASREK
ncbi:MAG: hypothetical protein VKK32_09705 [Candidatus Melainabacteria bacterium]|nr:hypothetical protein [Candidatus Melainabacteria bacterium]